MLFYHLTIGVSVTFSLQTDKRFDVGISCTSDVKASSYRLAESFVKRHGSCRSGLQAQARADSHIRHATAKCNMIGLSAPKQTVPPMVIYPCSFLSLPVVNDFVNQALLPRFYNALLFVPTSESITAAVALRSQTCFSVYVHWSDGLGEIPDMLHCVGTASCFHDRCPVVTSASKCKGYHLLSL